MLVSCSKGEVLKLEGGAGVQLLELEQIDSIVVKSC